LTGLFDPIQIGKVEIKNRIVLLGMGLGYGENFRVNARMTQLFARLAGFGFPFGKRVIIIGGGFAGCELADFLADRGKQVTVIGEASRVGEGIGADTIVLARALTENRDLDDVLYDTGIRVIRIGDAAAPAQVKEAIAAGFKAGIEM